MFAKSIEIKALGYLTSLNFTPFVHGLTTTNKVKLWSILFQTLWLQNHRVHRKSRYNCSVGQRP